MLFILVGGWGLRLFILSDLVLFDSFDYINIGWLVLKFTTDISQDKFDSGKISEMILYRVKFVLALLKFNF